MPSQITILPDHVINQIAAGEVVNAPFSIVKELVENAIDAQASHIQVFIENGGLSSITVTDNGTGMSKEDLLMAIQRHATSKLPSHNIYSVSTCGFRGEALPSIAAVSHITLSSKKNNFPAWSLCLDHGKLIDSCPFSRDEKGTTIEVQNLFHAIPARLKFLKTPLTETQRILSMLTHIALTVPHIKIDLWHQQRNLLSFPPSSRQERASQALQNKEDILPIQANIKDHLIEGFACVPTFNKKTSAHMFFIVNNRCCHSKLLTSYARMTFGDLIPKGRFPALALWLTLPNEDVDINAHPAKMDVRFRNSSNLHSIITMGLTETLCQMTPNTSTTLSQNIIEKLTPPLHQSSSQPPSFSQPQPYSKAWAPEAPLPRSIPKPSPSITAPPLLQKPLLGFPKCQLHNTYIVSESDDDIIIIDQHAAHERILYDKMKESAPQMVATQQKLLSPLPLHLDSQEAPIFEQWHHLLKQWGITVAQINEIWSITALPPILQRTDITRIIKDFCEQIIEQQSSVSPLEAIHMFCSSTACHGSIRAGKVLSIHEMQDLITSMEKLSSSAQCNHGRPTHIRLSKKDLHNLFERS